MKCVRGEGCGVEFALRCRGLFWENAFCAASDNTLVFYGGSNSAYHNARNYPLILAGGKNMGVKHGRYMEFNEEQVVLSDLFVSILIALGVPAKSFADSKGNLDQIFKA